MFKLCFITSNRIKLMHAKHLASDYDVQIRPKLNYGVGYSEPRIYEREKLLEESFKDAKLRWLRSVAKSQDKTSNIDKMFFIESQENKRFIDKMFFIEDTSVIIHSLSRDREIPGVDVKYWIKEHDFASVDKILRCEGNARDVTVRSDILLYLPKALQDVDGMEYKRFTSSSSGTITEKEYKFKTNLLYPWLDNRTFNKWFVPYGCKVPISMLSIEEADKHDFRRGAFKQMLEFLEKKRIIRRKSYDVDQSHQTRLPVLQIPIFLISGLPCSGKTTIGKYLANKLGYYHVEASDFMYLSYYQRHGVDSAVHIGDFAEQALKKTPSIVAEQIIENIKEVDNIPIVITGFRSPKEIDLFIQYYKGPFQIEAVYVSASATKRYERCIQRDRDDKSRTKTEFHDRDKQQLAMGLAAIRKRRRFKTITNDKDIDTYFADFLSGFKLKPFVKAQTEKKVPKIRPSKLEDAILIGIMASKKSLVEYLTSTEIAHLINYCFSESSLKTSKNNVSRYFNQYFYPYYEIKYDNGKIKYRLSQTGISKALLLLHGNH